MKTKSFLTAGMAVAVLGAGLTLATTSAQAGGFAIREQSVSSQGASFAGNAAGGDLSSMFWNSGALASIDGIVIESHYSLVVPDSELTAKTGTTAALLLGGFPQNTDIGKIAVIPASYYGMQLKDFDPRLFVGLAINSPFGLATEPDKRNWVGAQIARTSKIFNLNANPTVAYRIAPGIAIGAGLQVQYLEGTLKFATGTPTGTNTFFNGSDVGIGYTLGIYLTPAAGTKIGVGFRSAVKHELDGIFDTPGLRGLGIRELSARVDIETPEIVTVSIRQAITDRTRILGTFEWTNWSRFDQLQVISKGVAVTALGLQTPGALVATIEANWEDSWFASVGLEHDYSERLTVRGGVAFEESPITRPEDRIAGVPDSDRIWASVGATYKWSDTISLDFAYTHIFYDDAVLRRSGVTGAPTLVADVDNSVDILSLSFKYKIGEPPEALK